MKPRVIHRDVAEKYNFHKILGEGASGRVFLASIKSIEERPQTDSKVAIKILDK